ncbi:MAG: indole-3-glycerol-phosphate synthase [Cyclobacteriaceae bacterium]|nr:indole-3-glycerol-phosphate synthase [Cyclobacteriaceae bacterium]
MANILDKIVATKRQEVALSKQTHVYSLLESEIEYLTAVSLAKSFKTKPGIIAEFKRASPSKGVINGVANIETVVGGYSNGGASAISVLTDKSYFQARPDDFGKARLTTSKPMLRKEFIIDEYQLYESRAMGANVILLIAAILTKEEIRNFTKKAHQLGMEVLLELHDEDEISKVSGLEDMIGVNNRNLKTFEVDIQQSTKIKKQLASPETPMISESGLSGIEEIKYLISEGFIGFLMGEHFMKHSEPVQAFEHFILEFKKVITE